MNVFVFIEDLLVGLIGRPILTLIKWLRWGLLIAGILFNTLATYNPVTKHLTYQKTYAPLIIGFILFSIGSTIKRYDNICKIKEYI